MAAYRVTDNCPDGAYYGVGPHSFGGDATVTGNLSVTGTATIANVVYESETVSGDSTVTGGSKVTKTFTVLGTSVLQGVSATDATVVGLKATGTSTLHNLQATDSTFTGTCGFFGPDKTGKRDSSAAATAFTVSSIGLAVDSSGIYGFDSSASGTTIISTLSTLVTECNSLRSALIEKGLIG